MPPVPARASRRTGTIAGRPRPREAGGFGPSGQGGAFVRHGGAASHGREPVAPPCPPSLRGREAAEAIQAEGAAREDRDAYIVAAPLLDCFALACARARNDGGAGGAANSVRAAYRVAAPFLDCFARASRGLAMTGENCRSRSQ